MEIMEEIFQPEFNFQIPNLSEYPFHPGELCPCIFCYEETSSVNKTFTDTSAKILCNLLNIKGNFSSGFLLAPICTKCDEIINSMVRVYNSIQALEIQLQLQKETLLSYLKDERVEINPEKSKDRSNNVGGIPNSTDIFSASKFRKNIQELGFLSSTLCSSEQLDTIEVTIATGPTQEESPLNVKVDVKVEDDGQADISAGKDTNANLMRKCCVRLVRIQALDDVAKEIMSRNNKHFRIPQGTILLASKYEKHNVKMLRRSKKLRSEVRSMKNHNFRSKDERSLPSKKSQNIKQKKPESFLCEDCGEDFGLEKNFVRHKHRIHGIPLPNRCWQEKCQLDFQSAEELKRHDDEKHPTFQCEQCGKVIKNQNALTQHINRIHGKTVRAQPSGAKCKNKKPSGSKYSCETCNYSTKIKCNFQSHLATNTHIRAEKGNPPPVAPIKNYSCETCNYHTLKNYAFLNHLDSLGHKYRTKGADNLSGIPNKKKLKCPEVNCEFFTCIYRYSLLDNHLESVHGATLEIENLQFPSIEDFETWKTKLQEIENVKYTREMHPGASVRHYCNRSGNYHSKSKGFRKTKSIGTIKTGTTCPSRIIVKNLPGGGIGVKYHKTHVGHDMDPRRFGLTTEQKREMVEALANGLSRTEVRKQIASECADTNKRIALTSAIDMYNVAKLLKKTNV